MKPVLWAATVTLLVAMCDLAAPRLVAAQSVTASERAALVRLRVDRGGQAEDVEGLLRHADEAAAKGLPAAPLANKIREGLAKGADPQRIEQIIRQMAAHLETADRLLREMKPAPGDTTAAVTLLAEALGGGVTADEVRELRRQAQPSGTSMSTESMAAAAKGLSFIKDARLPVVEGTTVIAEAARQGFRPYQILAVGREVKRREGDYQAGRASLRALRDAIARGDRPDDLFPDRAVQPVERPAATRPDTGADRPERPTRPEVPERPQPVRPDRPDRPERSGERGR